jgi:hypothetical protein
MSLSSHGSQDSTNSHRDTTSPCKIFFTIHPLWFTGSWDESFARSNEFVSAGTLKFPLSSRFHPLQVKWFGKIIDMLRGLKRSYYLSVSQINPSHKYADIINFSNLTFFKRTA